MASASSSAARLLIREGKSAAGLLLRARTANLTETMQYTGPAIRSLFLFNQTPASQYPVFSKTSPVMQSGFRVSLTQPGHGKRVVDNEGSDSEETDFDEEEFDDIDDDDEFDEIDEDDDEEEGDKNRKKK